MKRRHWELLVVAESPEHLPGDEPRYTPLQHWLQRGWHPTVVTLLDRDL